MKQCEFCKAVFGTRDSTYCSDRCHFTHLILKIPFRSYVGGCLTCQRTCQVCMSPVKEIDAVLSCHCAFHVDCLFLMREAITGSLRCCSCNVVINEADKNLMETLSQILFTCSQCGGGIYTLDYVHLETCECTFHDECFYDRYRNEGKCPSCRTHMIPREELAVEKQQANLNMSNLITPI